MKNDNTISAKEARAELALYMNDINTDLEPGLDLDGHRGCTPAR